MDKVKVSAVWLHIIVKRKCMEQKRNQQNKFNGILVVFLSTYMLEIYQVPTQVLQRQLQGISPRAK